MYIKLLYKTVMLLKLERSSHYSLDELICRDTSIELNVRLNRIRIANRRHDGEFLNLVSGFCSKNMYYLLVVLQLMQPRNDRQDEIYVMTLLIFSQILAGILGTHIRPSYQSIAVILNNPLFDYCRPGFCLGRLRLD